MKVYLPKPCTILQLLACLEDVGVDFSKLVVGADEFRQIVLSNIHEDEEGRRYIEINEEMVKHG